MYEPQMHSGRTGCMRRQRRTANTLRTHHEGVDKDIVVAQRIEGVAERHIAARAGLHHAALTGLRTVGAQAGDTLLPRPLLSQPGLTV